MMGQFLNVVYQAEQLPLYIHFHPAAQGEAVQFLVVANIAKHRLYGGKASAVLGTSFRTVDTLFHFVGVTFSVKLTLEESNLPCFALLRVQ